MPGRISSKELEINQAIAVRLRVLKAEKGWLTKDIVKLFRCHGLSVSVQRVTDLLAGKRRMSSSELIILEAQGLSTAEVRNSLVKGGKSCPKIRRENTTPHELKC